MPQQGFSEAIINGHSKSKPVSFFEGIYDAIGHSFDTFNILRDIL